MTELLKPNDPSIHDASLILDTITSIQLAPVAVQIEPLPPPTVQKKQRFKPKRSKKQRYFPQRDSQARRTHPGREGTRRRQRYNNNHFLDHPFTSLNSLASNTAIPGKREERESMMGLVAWSVPFRFSKLGNVLMGPEESEKDNPEGEASSVSVLSRNINHGNIDEVEQCFSNLTI
ncbi:uncharacterized protein VTP21DRAFT_10844 [Calcarisporiella thermophila]|uniref:uncharacterized protein n=1 Tax=Calcarisporiella thermophila TaxID=911321 RepID=UPI0037442013